MTKRALALLVLFACGGSHAASKAAPAPAPAKVTPPPVAVAPPPATSPVPPTPAPPPGPAIPTLLVGPEGGDELWPLGCMNATTHQVLGGDDCMRGWARATRSTSTTATRS